MTERYYRNRRILRGYNDLFISIDNLASRCAELETKATRIVQTLSDEPSPANHEAKSRVENDSIKLAEVKAILEKKVARKRRIDKAIKGLPYKWQFIVKEVDINGKSLRAVTKQLKMNYPYVCSKHAEIVEGLRI